MEEQNSIPSRNNNEETTAEVFPNKFEIGKATGTNQISQVKTGEKEEVVQKAKKMKETVFVVGNSMLKKVDEYLLTNSINHKVLVKEIPFTTTKTINIYDHLNLV